MPKPTYEELKSTISKLEKENTEFKKVEKDLHEIFDLSLDMICIAGLDGFFKKINPAFIQLLGFTEEELLSIPFLDFIHPDDVENTYKAVKEKLAVGETAIKYVNRYRCKNGSYVWLSWHSHLVPEQELMYAVARNISNTKNAEETLRQSEVILQSIFRSAPIGIGLVSNRVMLWTNEKLTEITGYSAEEMVGQGTRLIYPSDEEYEIVGKKKYDQIREHGTGTVETKWKRKDGTVIDVLLSSTPLAQDDLAGGVTFTALDITEQKNTERSLKESESKFRNIVESSPLGIHMYKLEEDSNLIFIDFNAEANSMLGIDCSQFIGKTIEDAFPPLAQTEVPKRYKDAASKGKSWYTEQIDYEDQQIRGAYQVYAFQTSPGFMVAMFQDIKDRKRTEEELERTKALLSAAIESSPAGILIADAPDGNIRFANAAALGIRGKTSKPLSDIPVKFHPKNWQAYYPDGTLYKPEDLPLSRAVFNGETINNVEIIVKRQDGEKRWILGNAAPVRDAEGNITAGVVVFPDITDLKRAEEALKIQQAYLERLIESAPEAIVLLDNNDIIMQVNEEFTNMFGYTFEEAVGKGTFELIAIGDLSKEAEQYSKLISKKKILNVETKRTHKDGHLVDVSILAAPITHEGKQMGIYAIYRDISDRKRSEEERKRLEEQLFQAQKMESIGRLAGGVAHDFNNILAGIMGYAELLKMQFDDTESPEGQAAEVILESAERASDLTGQLLGFARKGKFHPQPVRLNDIIKQTLKVSEKIFEKNIEIVMDFNKNIEIVEADVNQLNQVFTNLFINAKDAMPGGGKLLIKTDNVDLDEYCTLQFPDLKPGSYVSISVSDNGTGMPKEIRDHIFEPFFTTKGEGKGTGLGLATVYGIVKNHGGHINVYSESGEGTNFTLYFPISEKRISRIKKTAKIIKGTGTIMIVDDEENVRNLADYMLSKLGYDVITAADGIDAIDIYRRKQKSIDLVILDMIMPNMAGKETFLALRQINPKVKVLISSGYSQNGVASEILTEGAFGFIQKPFRIEEVSKMIADTLKQKRKKRKK
ncbi:MAG: PAS domain S-box protein [bacterium]|nr:PAS domain S-box protein [bacterium]